MIGDGSAVRLASVDEVTQGTTPATPPFETVRTVSESFKVDLKTVTSNEVRADRNVSDLHRVASGAMGGFEFELSYGSFDKYLESLFLSTFTANVLKNGVNQSKFFTFEKTFELGAIDSLMRYTGNVTSEMNLRIAAEQLVTGNFGFIGFGGTVATTAIAGATYAAVNDNELVNAAADFAGLTMTGIATTPQIQSLDVKFANNARMQKAVGSLNAVGIGYGQFVVTGSLRAYFEDNNLYQAYLSGTPYLLQFTLGSVTTEKYTIALPRCRTTSAEVLNGGNGQDVMANVQFQALYNAADTASAKITRAVA